MSGSEDKQYFGDRLRNLLSNWRTWRPRHPDESWGAFAEQLRLLADQIDADANSVAAAIGHSMRVRRLLVETAIDRLRFAVDRPSRDVVDAESLLAELDLIFGPRKTSSSEADSPPPQRTPPPCEEQPRCRFRVVSDDGPWYEVIDIYADGYSIAAGLSRTYANEIADLLNSGAVS